MGIDPSKLTLEEETYFFFFEKTLISNYLVSGSILLVSVLSVLTLFIFTLVGNCSHYYPHFTEEVAEITHYLRQSWI